MLLHRHFFLSAACFLGWASLLAGCAGGFNRDFKHPEVTLSQIELIKAKLFEQKFVLRFRIENPNNYPLPVRGLVYTVYLDEIKLASGESNRWAEIPPQDYEYYEIPIRTSLWQHMKFVSRQLDKPSQPVYYRLEGHLRTGLFFSSVPVDHDGEILPAGYTKD